MKSGNRIANHSSKTIGLSIAVWCGSIGLSAQQIAHQPHDAAVDSAYAARARVAALTGFVTDSAGQPLNNVDVSIPSLNLATRTDSVGRYRISGITAGIHAVVARRVGFGPMTASLVFVDDETEERNFVLRRVTVLDSVDVRANRLNPDQAEFETRRRMGIGTFLTAEQLSKFPDRTLASVAPRLSGARLARGGGNRVWLVSLRSNGRLNGASRDGNVEPSEADKQMGARNGCYAKVYVDNVMRYGGHDKENLFDLNSIQTNDIEMIEYYAGAAQTPAMYLGPGANCGVLVIRMKNR